MEPEELAVYQERMRCRARDAFFSRVPFETITQPYHLSALKYAISNVLSTNLSIETFAQIVDGLPLADVAWDRRLRGLHFNHPIDDHEELCPGCEDKARELLKDWDPTLLKFNPETIKTYEQSRRGSKAFHLRLIELVAASIHQTASMLYQLNLRLHQGNVDSYVFWRYPEQPAESKVRPTMFYHPHYVDWDVYPEGAADMTGYWVEDRIFGGVLSFDRRDPNLTATPDSELPNAYMMTSRDRMTTRVWQLKDDQQESLITFLLATEDLDVKCPFPILPDRTNQVRIDDWIPLATSKVYRDEWERRPVTKEEHRFKLKRPQDEVDYPEIRDLVFELNRRASVPFPGKGKVEATPASEEGKDLNVTDS